MTRGKQKWVSPTGSRLECVQFSAGLAPMVGVLWGEKVGLRVLDRYSISFMFCGSSELFS